MKHKFSSMGRVAIALVLALSLSLVMVAPVSASEVSDVTVTTVDPTTASEPAKYTIEFNTNFDLLNGGEGDNIVITFPTGTGVPTTYITGDITVEGTDAGDAPAGVGQVVTIPVPVNISATQDNPVTVVFTTAAGITNPSTAGDYTLKVSTSKEPTAVTSSAYTITLAEPTVTSVGPEAANQGETLDVYIKGTDFVEGMTVSFSGTKITVDEVSVVDEDDEAADYLIATITIAPDAAKTTRDVTVTTTAGTSEISTDTVFAVNEVGTKLVDGFDATLGGDLEAAGWLLYVDCSEVDIQDALNNVGSWTDADTLRVHAATYPETLRIDVPGLTVESIMGAAGTIIDAKALEPAFGYGIHGAAVMITAEGVTFGGTDKGFTVKDAGVGVDNPAKWADDNNDGIADITGVFVWPNGGSNGPDDTLFDRVSVIGNTIYGSQAKGICADVGAWGTNEEPVVSVYIAENTVYDNLFEGFCGDGLGSDGAVPALDTIIEDNEFRNNGPSGGLTEEDDDWTDAGIQIDSTESGDTVSILGNDVHDNYSAGIYLLENATVGTLIIEENTIHDNGGYGIYTKAETPANITCQYNDIYGNTDWGINNDFVSELVAKYNWWGEISGPSADPVATEQVPPVITALGQGDVVSKNVIYDPWLTTDQATAVSDGIAYHGSTMVLEAGWNTLSVPLALDDGADTIAEIMLLGDFITDDNVEIVYQYTESGWQNVGTSAIELVPGRGYYIKTKVTDTDKVTFPVLYSGALGLPAFDLSAGWNLIGSGFGIDKVAGSSDISVGDYGVCSLDPTGTQTYGEAETDATDADDESWKKVKDALDSIGANASVVISPSMPGQEAVWAVLAASDTEFMIVGEGYWVFMTAPATLAGFEITPIYWIE